MSTAKAKTIKSIESPSSNKEENLIIGGNIAAEVAGKKVIMNYS